MTLMGQYHIIYITQLSFAINKSYIYIAKYSILTLVKNIDVNWNMKILNLETLVYFKRISLCVKIIIYKLAFRHHHFFSETKTKTIDKDQIIQIH